MKKEKLKVYNLKFKKFKKEKKGKKKKRKLKQKFLLWWRDAFLVLWAAVGGWLAWLVS